MALSVLQWWADWALWGTLLLAEPGRPRWLPGRIATISPLHFDVPSFFSIWCIICVTSLLPAPPLFGSVTVVLSCSSREDNLPKAAIQSKQGLIRVPGR